ncbi:hypothetical protein Ga0080574_TMP1296 [Salipiger abyssi]|uniref:Uncharacterized protein n=1 Tax=Salipiger abyssi TaxID=1250539 RepID=A0A1P8UQF8_9RHOB|nr:hypothetical protein Ga0080574_TMP1296 [Salipiger abyssi]
MRSFPEISAPTSRVAAPDSRPRAGPGREYPPPDRAPGRVFPPVARRRALLASYAFKTPRRIDKARSHDETDCQQDFHPSLCRAGPSGCKAWCGDHPRRQPLDRSRLKPVPRYRVLPLSGDTSPVIQLQRVLAA